MDPSFRRAVANFRLRRMRRRLASVFALVVVGACIGCGSIFRGAMPSSFARRDDQRIAKQAAAEKFPSPADVGLTTPSSVPGRRWGHS